jgi:tetratricopeptide (TPR) repeat protein
VEAADAIFERTGKQGGRAMVQSLLAQQDLWRGHPAAALARLEPLQQEFPLRHDERQVLAEALFEVGDQTRTAALVEEGIEQTRAERRRVNLVEWLRLEGMLRRRAGKWDHSQAAFEEALSLANTMPYPYGAARVLYEFGRLQVARKDLLPGRGRWEEAITIFRRLGAQPYIDRIELALAEFA